jgi:hypothetical protein
MNDRIIVSSICDLNLHDSELLDVVVKMDEVTMHLDYIEDYETMKCTRRDLVFRKCSNVVFKINSGYAPPDSILFGDESASEEGRRIRIKLNTSASVIEITAKEIELI